MGLVVVVVVNGSVSVAGEVVMVQLFSAYYHLVIQAISQDQT